MLKNEQPFAFTGIWEMYRTKTGVEIPTFSIITTPANDMISELHDRMPAILEPKYEQLWIDNSADLGLALETLKPYPPDQMQMYKVSPLVNAVRNDVPGVITPV